MGQLIAWIVRALAKASSTTIAAIGKRIGMTSPSVSGIIATVKANPVTAALVAAELGMASSDILGQMSDTAPGQLSQIRLLLENNDEIPTDEIPITSIGNYADEMAAIKEMVGVYGTLDKVLTARRVFLMEDQFFNLYTTLRDLRY